VLQAEAICPKLQAVNFATDVRKCDAIEPYGLLVRILHAKPGPIEGAEMFY